MRKLNEDRIGLGWRKELAHSILSHLDQIDVVEVILDDYFSAPKKHLQSLQTLSSQVPILYHGVSLGLASSFPIQEKRLEKLAHLFDFLQPEIWSEHLAFVRTKEIEIGHLAAPPRTDENVDATLTNLSRIKKIVGSYPVLENIATLIDPPGSTLSEAMWTSAILKNSNAGLLLDLHNLYSNAVNFGHDPFEYLKQFPLDQVKMVHLSGGHWIPEPSLYAKHTNVKRLLDDHVHDVPDIVFDLLKVVGEKVPHPLAVIIERDGEYPAFQVLLDQIQRARSSLSEGRKAFCE